MNTYLSDDQRKSAIDDIVNYFTTERDQRIGNIGAGEILDFFLETIGPAIYNQGIADSKKIIDTTIANLNFEIDMLKKQQLTIS